MLLFYQKGVPGLYLVETDEKKCLNFMNSNTETMHSVIDFYRDELEEFYSFLKEKGVLVGEFKLIEGHGGFGFTDLDGNRSRVCNILQPGQA